MHKHHHAFTCGLTSLCCLLSLQAAEWTAWRGQGDGTSADSGHALVDDLASARLLWESEERIPGTYEGDSRKGVARLKARIPGGYASPIVAEGKVFLYYYLPHGPAHDKAITDKIVSQGGFGRVAWHTDADEVLLCVDAASGKTLWRRVLVETGFNLEGPFNKGGGQFTPCYANGRVYALGTSARVFCADAKTGALLWERDTGIRARHVEMRKDAWRENHAFSNGARNDFAGCVIAVDDVVIVSDHQEYKNGPRGIGKSNGLVGLDAATGALRFYVPGAGGSGMLTATPVIWRHQDQAYIIASGFDGLYCISPTDGRVLWTQAGGRFDNAAALHGDLLICHHEKILACYQLSPKGATLLWNKGDSMGHISPMVRAGHVYAVSKAGLRCISLTDGKLVAGPLPQESISGSLAGADGVIVAAASARGKSGMNLFRASPTDFKQLGGRLPIPFANSTTAAIADGRVYFRGRDRLLCLDLRKQP